ncbi:TIGR03826 family flagellar region protein [Virgibacillus sediminis]|uniref:TIGR03826 family flagellar region protein n=1 Tax=Virgibacillus sediminis TaxID=202260 RepID=A0ABV7A2Y8_9BACI
MAELANCERCDSLFVGGIRKICPTCFEKEENAFQTVYLFLGRQENREATISQIVEATGVSDTLIIKFVKEKRLRPSKFPKLSYPCERCGEAIIGGTVCTGCSAELRRELASYEEMKAGSHKQDTLNEKSATYYVLSRKNKK